MKLLYLLIAFSISITCMAQGQYEMTGPLEINQLGYNRVLCMKNGNTLLFHFEKDKRILVKVFDSTRKEIASRQDHYKILDFQRYDFKLKAVYEINNEAVLFFDQDLAGKHSLIRMRYNSRSGTLAEEITIAESKNENRRMHFYPIKYRDSENYELLFCTDKSHPRQSDIYIVFFDSLHHSMNEIQLPVDRKKYDDLAVVGAESWPNGVLITLALTKTMVYAIGGSQNPIGRESSVDNHFLQFFYIPMASKKPGSAIVELSTGVFPYRAHYTYNPFAETLNLLLYSYKEMSYQFGQNIQTGNVNKTLFFKLNEHDITSSVGLNIIKNAQADSVLKKNTKSTNLYDGRPLIMYTNENGLSTIFSESLLEYKQQETINRTSTNYCIHRIGITQVDDNGNEVWGTMLPLSQFLNSYSMYPLYSYEFMGIHPHRIGRNFYIAYNDNNKNFNNSLSDPGDTVFAFSATNACYYKMDAKKEITKHYLFGTPKPGEYKCGFIQGSYFDEQRSVFATLIQYKRGDEISLRMAWSHLDQ
jgi:hypothetical protein